MKPHFAPRLTYVPLLRLAAVTIVAVVIAAGCARITGFAEPKLPQELEDGKTYLSAGDTNNAVSRFEAAIASAPKNPRVYAEIMTTSARYNHRDLVDRYYRQATEATMSLPARQQAAVHLHAGVAYLNLRDPERAVQVMSKAYELAPNWAPVLNGLGYAYAEADRNHEKAKELVRKAIELARKEGANAEVLGAFIDSLGWAYFQDDDDPRSKDEAVKYLSEAASLAPAMGEIQYHLGLAYERTKRLNEARIALSRATIAEPEMTAYKRALDRVTEILKERGELPPESEKPAPSESLSPQ